MNPLCRYNIYRQSGTSFSPRNFRQRPGLCAKNVSRFRVPQKLTILAPRAGPKYQPTSSATISPFPASHHAPSTRHQAPPPPSTSAPPKYLSINISVPGGFLRGGGNFYKGNEVKGPPDLDPNVRQCMVMYAFLPFSMPFLPLFLGSTFRQSALRAPLRPQTRWEWDTWARIRTNRLSGFAKPDN